VALKDSYFTITQAARELGVTRQTISRWIELGKLTAEKVGRETLIAKQEFNKPEFKIQKMRTSVAKQFNKKLLASIKTECGYEDETDLAIKEIRPIGKNKANYVLSIMKKDGTRQIINAEVELLRDEGKISKEDDRTYSFEIPVRVKIDDEDLNINK
jgi:excisionase family DNA binding protein